MKKLLLITPIISSVFATSLEERVSNLEQEVKILKEEIKKLTNSQKELKTFKTNVQKEIQKGVLLTCSKLKLIKLYDCTDKCKTDGSALKELCLVRDGILNIDIDLDNDFILCFINWMCED